MDELLGLALRISIMYVFALTLMRLSGKRSVTSLTPMDFVVVTIIGDLFDDVFWSEIPLSQGIVALTTIFVVHTLMAYGEAKSDGFKRLVSSSRTVVVKNARLVRDGLERERTNENEVYSQLRLHEEEDLQQVKEGSWEVNGELSVLRKDFAKEVQKQDLPRLKERLP